MVAYTDIIKQYSILCHQVDALNKNKLNLAQHIYYWYSEELFNKEPALKSSDIYDFSKKKLDLSRKTINSYLDVVHVYFDMKINMDEGKNVFQVEFTLKDDYFNSFNYSQLKACLKLNVNELISLDIDSSNSVHEIEKKKKEYLKQINKAVSEITDQEDTQEIQKQDNTFVSLNDNKRNIDIFKNNYIPENSEFEVLFRQDKTLFKGNKKEYNNVTALKIMRQMLETNSENEFYYAVVKIKKPL